MSQCSGQDCTHASHGDTVLKAESSTSESPKITIKDLKGEDKVVALDGSQKIPVSIYQQQLIEQWKASGHRVAPPITLNQAGEAVWLNRKQRRAMAKFQRKIKK